METNKANKNVPGGYQGEGVGAAEASMVEVTNKGKYPNDNTGPGRSVGETDGAGSLYLATLNERPNRSNTRNQGPERAPSRQGATPLPVVTQSDRATGRLSGRD